MIPADTVTHTITLTIHRRQHLDPLHGARCTCKTWRLDGLTREKRDASVAKHVTYNPGAEVVR